MNGVVYFLCIYTLVSGPSSHVVASPVTKDTIEKILGTSFHVNSNFEFVGKVGRNVTGAGYHRKMKTSVKGQVIGKIGVPDVIIPRYLVLGYKVGPHEVTYQGY